MIFSTKFKFTLLAAAFCLATSCKKTEVTPASNLAADNAAKISKQIASDLFLSLTSGVSSSKSIKTTSASGKIATRDLQHECGEIVKSATNKSRVSGDTTFAYTGNSIFTYMCNGYYNNGYNLDAYTLIDDLTTTEKGKGFENIYNVKLNFDVRSTEAFYNELTIAGKTSTSSYTSIIADGSTTESHKIFTEYQWKKVDAWTNGYGYGVPRYMAGTVDFNTTITDTNAATKTGLIKNAYSGYIQFLNDDTAKVYFTDSTGTRNIFIINRFTGEVRAVNS